MRGRARHRRASAITAAGALLIGLHGEAEAVPAASDGSASTRAITSSDSSRRSASSASRVKLRSWPRAWRASSSTRGTSSVQHALARHRLVARMQRRELDRNPRPRPATRRRRRSRRSRRSRPHRPRDSARRRRRCGRPRPACRTSSANSRCEPGAPQRLLDGLPQHEMQPSIRIACRVATRTVGRPSRFTHAVDDGPASRPAG